VQEIQVSVGEGENMLTLRLWGVISFPNAPY